MRELYLGAYIAVVIAIWIFSLHLLNLYRKAFQIGSLEAAKRYLGLSWINALVAWIAVLALVTGLVYEN